MWDCIAALVSAILVSFCREFAALVFNSIVSYTPFQYMIHGALVTDLLQT